jgi:DNA-binding LacI/PurR family transcriptional regulator
VNLTTVGQDVPRLASLAVHRLTTRLDHGESTGPEDVVAPHLIVRGTTGPDRRALTSLAGRPTVVS